MALFLAKSGANLLCRLTIPRNDITSGTFFGTGKFRIDFILPRSGLIPCELTNVAKNLY